MSIPITLVYLIVFLIGLVIAYWLGNKFGKFNRDRYWEGELPNYRKDAIMKSRAVLGGQFSEQLAPYLPNFEYLPTECRFLGKPIDFIVFKGMDEKKIDEVVFVEVKSGNAKLNAHEKNLKEAIDKKRVKWVEYRIPEELTEKRDIEDKIEGFTKSEKKKRF
jgi:predicted Holliday junction resolvase-like endonuclease